MRGLSPRQEAFCMAYAKCGNATQAYREAGYKAKSDNVAAASAAKILRNAKVQARLEEIRGEVESERIVQPREMQEWYSSIIRGETADGGKETRMRDRLKAAELLGRMQGLFIDKREVSMSGGVVILHDDVPEED